MARLSILICCRNNRDTIEQACQSATWADELVVVDAESDDGTDQIARRYANTFITEPWRGHSAQKKWAAQRCRNDWILIVDSDEEVSNVLRDELQAMPDAALETLDLLLVPRRTWLFGREVRMWRPDYVTRLFHRRRVRWNDHVLHDAREASAPSRLGRCRGWLWHKRHRGDDFSEYFSGRRFDGRLLAVARQMHQQGRRCHWWDLALRPWLAFVKFYLLKGGLLDGTFGLLVAQKAATGIQLKYAALWFVQRHPDQVDGSQPPAT